MKFSPSDWHMYLHCSSPGYDKKMLEILFCFFSKWNKLKAFFWPTLWKAYSWDPRIEWSCVWLQVEGMEVCLGALLCHEIQLSALTWLQEDGKKDFLKFYSMVIMSEPFPDKSAPLVPNAHRGIQGIVI